MFILTLMFISFDLTAFSAFVTYHNFAIECEIFTDWRLGLLDNWIIKPFDIESGIWVDVARAKNISLLWRELQ